MKTASYLLAFVLLIVLAVGGYYVKRWFNYNVGYESRVSTTVCQMVKPEFLREGVCK